MEKPQIQPQQPSHPQPQQQQLHHLSPSSLHQVLNLPASATTIVPPSLPPNARPSAHVLFEISPLEGRDEIDERTQRTYTALKQMIAGKSPKECHEIFHKYIASSQAHLEELTMGLLVAILVEPDGQQSRYYSHVISISKDGQALFSQYLNHIITDRLSKLRDNSVKHIFWVTNQLMKSNAATAENICSNLIRQTAGGDLSSRNLWLVENLLEILIDNRSWLINLSGFMVPTVIYTFVRLILDHLGPAQASLRQREVDFVIGLIREKFLDCTHIGRDFLRLLHSILKVPEFEKLWHDIFNNPKSLHPTFQNPLQLLANRTPRRLFQSRLTFDMERKISFLATQVKFGNQKRYQDWFHRQYFSTPESLSLRCDLIRYICTIIHPSNEVLCSDIIPRWAIIGWLLTTCTTSSSASNSRLALFFDWLLYDSKMDNIMNIEPAILVMYYSLRSHPQVTASLLDFLCKIPSTFSPKLSEHIKSGLKKSLQQILEKRVVGSLAPLFDNPKHDPALRALIRETFPEFCNSQIILDNGTAPLIANPIPLSPTTASPACPQATAAMTTLTPATVPSCSAQQTPSTNPAHQAKLTNDVVIIDDKLALPSTATMSPSSLSNYSNSASAQINAAKAELPIQTNAALSSNKPTTNSLNQEVTHPSGLAADVTQTEDTSKASRNEEVVSDSCTGNGNVTSSESNASPKTQHDIKNSKNNIPPKNNSTSNSSQSLPNAPFRDGSPRKASKPMIQPLSSGIDSATLSRSINSSMTPVGSIADFSNNLLGREAKGPLQVIYPFMTVPELDVKEAINALDEPHRGTLEEYRLERSCESRCSLMNQLISTDFEQEESIARVCLIKNLGHILAHLVVSDFSTRIFPSISSQFQQHQLDIEALEGSLHKPFFSLCHNAFMEDDLTDQQPQRFQTMGLLCEILKYFEAAGFLTLYFLRVMSITDGIPVSSGYVEFCNKAKRNFDNCLYDDLNMALTYDAEMFCFLLPAVFGEIAASGQFKVTGNIDLIKLVVSAIDPINLQELICLCLTGNAKVINKEEVLPLIESSLKWESLEQYCVWKLISAQSVPIENYLSVLPKLNAKENAEAMSCILLNLQKVQEPTVSMLQQLINCECTLHDPFIPSILRYWSIKTDINELARMICSLCDSRPSSPQVKRKGHFKGKSSQASISQQSEKILGHLDSIRQRAPKNKLLAQTEIIEMLSQLQPLCNETQRKRFVDLFSYRPKSTKKQRQMDKELTA